MSKKTVAIDFDGVLHRYTSGWQGVLRMNDGPVDGAMAWLRDMVDNFNVVVFTCRCVGDGVDTKAAAAGIKSKLTRWLMDDGLKREQAKAITDKIRVTGEKPRASIYIDDRGYHFFDGVFPTVEFIDAFRPWYKGDG